MIKKMNPDVKDQWVTALESGEYKQATRVLHNEVADSFCCLGVLCDLAVKAGVEIEVKTLDHATIDMKYDGTLGYNVPVRGAATMYGDASTVLPPQVQHWAGLGSDTADFDNGDHFDSLTRVNDDGGSFTDIATIIKERF